MVNEICFRLFPGKMIILGVAMISVGIIIGAILHRYLYRNKKPIEEEWLALTNQE